MSQEIKKYPKANDKTIFHIDNYYLDNPRVFGKVTLLQIGRRFCEIGEIIGEHTHGDFYEITVATAGKGDIFSGGKCETVRPGDIYLSYPGEIHDVRTADGEKFYYDFFAFSADEPYRGELEKIAASNPDTLSRIFRDERVGYLIAMAISEFSNDNIHKEEIIGSILVQVLIYIIRNLTGQIKVSSDTSDRDVFCQQIMNYIDTHIHSLSSLAEISDKFGYNYSYISNLFKQTTGNTLSDYYRGKRLDTARVLIEEGKKTVGEISEMLGYSTPFAFSAAYKKRFGISPKYSKTKLKG